MHDVWAKPYSLAQDQLLSSDTLAAAVKLKGCIDVLVIFNRTVMMGMPSQFKILRLEKQQLNRTWQQLNRT